jgi:hypothetical protein
MIQVTFQFKTIEEAVATLGTLLQRGAPVPNVDKPAADPSGKSSNRKPRADAGKKRGSYKNVEAPAAPAEADKAQPSGVTPPDASTPETAAPQPSTATEPPAPSQEDVGQGGVADAAVPDEKAVQAALDKVFTAKGLKPTMALLAEFGVAKGRDLKPEQRAAFVAKAEDAAK